MSTELTSRKPQILSIILFLFVFICYILLFQSLDSKQRNTELSFQNAGLTPLRYKSQEKMRRKNGLKTNSNKKKNALGKKCLSKPMLVYVCGGSIKRCAGWGDRLKRISCMYVVAAVTKRKLQIIMDSPCPISNFLTYNTYNWEECLPFIEPPQRSDIARCSKEETYIGLREGGHIYSEMSKRRVFFTNGFDTHTCIRDLGSRNDVQEMFPQLKYFKIGLFYHDVLTALFKPQARLKADIADFLEKHKTGKELICAHVRTFHANPKPIVPFLKRYSNKKKYSIYVAMDNEQIKDKWRKLYGNWMILLSNEVIHVDHVGFNQTADCEGFYTVLLEQYLLSKCDLLVISPSGFGRLAANMRGTSKRLYCLDGGVIIPCGDSTLLKF